MEAGNSAESKNCSEDVLGLHSSAKTRFVNSPAKHCRRIFRVADIAVPTSFIVLPYELRWDPETKQLAVPTKDHIELAEQIGQLLLTINKITAKLSFWLAMKTRLPDNCFRQKLKEWINRARTENTKLVASEVVKEIRCRMAYVGICQEILEKDDAHSKARAYINDPVQAATDEFRVCIKSLHKCYASGKYYLYLIDEYLWTPVVSQVEKFGISYPLRMNASQRLLEELFLPFMNISLMVSTAIYGLPSLARLLGCRGVPTRWMRTKEGMVHSALNPASVGKFASLQRVIREEVLLNASVRNGLGNYCPSHDQLPSELELLKIFYKGHDHASQFSDLRRVSDGNGAKIWVSEPVLQKLLDEVHLIRAERRLQRLQSQRSMMEVEEEMKMVMMTVKNLQGLDNSTLSWQTAETEQSNNTSDSETTAKTRKTKFRRYWLARIFKKLCKCED